MKKLGLFGLTIGEEYDGLGASLLLYALAVEEIARGWMSVSGIINTHFIVAHMIARHGTAEAEGLLPAQDGGRRGPWRLLHVRTGPGLGCVGDPDQGGARRRGLRDQRPEDVADQRRDVQPGGGALPDR